MSKFPTMWLCSFEASICLFLVSCSFPLKTKLYMEKTKLTRIHYANTHWVIFVTDVIFIFIFLVKKIKIHFNFLEATHRKSQIINLTWHFYSRKGLSWSVNERTGHWDWYEVNDSQMKATQGLNKVKGILPKTKLLGFTAFSLFPVLFWYFLSNCIPDMFIFNVQIDVHNAQI